MVGCVDKRYDWNVRDDCLSSFWWLVSFDHDHSLLSTVGDEGSLIITQWFVCLNLSKA